VIVKRVRPTGRTKRTGDLFIGEHEYQNAIGSDSAQFRMSELTFRDGARTKMHVHDSEQVVLVTDGEGIVATATDEQRIGVGDVALIPAGEPHWHGAPPDGAFTQWSILGPHNTRLA
jgi:quercetin dioxygenase-like cupin family protein